MELQLVNFEQAKSLKELGFPQDDYYDGSIIPMYEENGEFIESRWIDEEDYFAPTLELVVKWFREEHDIHIEINLNDRRCLWTYIIVDINTFIGTKDYDESTLNYGLEYSSYEKALSAGIDKAIEILYANNK